MKNDLVVKSNDLIQARYKLSLNEQKVLLHSISKLNRDKPEMNIIPIRLGNFIELLGTTKYRYKEVRDIITDLRDRQLIIDTGNGEIITSWLVSIEYKRNIGMVELEFSHKLIPYLLQLKEKFTRYQIKNILYMNNKYSIRIYELLKQYETIGKRTLGVKELKQMLQIESQYKRFYDFEKRVLEPTMEEINNHTDIKVSYEKLKKSRSISEIKYSIEPKRSCEYKKYLEETYNIKDMKKEAGLEDENFNSEQMIKIYEIACQKMEYEQESKSDILSYININYKEMMKKKDSIRNRFSYLLDMLKNDRAKAVVYIRANKKAL